MKFLIDTNILIPLEPLSSSDTELLSTKSRELYRKIQEQGYRILIHPLSITDIKKDKTVDRRAFRFDQIEKYPQLNEYPEISKEIKDIFGYANKDSNDWVDHHLISAVTADAVDFLITEDRKLRHKMRKLGYGERVLQIVDALQYIDNLTDKAPTPPPKVKSTKAHLIPKNDPIFDSLRKDYHGFDKWLVKCSKEHRQTWLIESVKGSIAAICIIKEESNPNQFKLKKCIKLLKICTFKVSHDFSGNKFGELLLKSVFDFLYSNNYSHVYVTVFSKHARLIELLEDFGFSTAIEQANNELVMIKCLSPDWNKNISPLDFHIAYGPKFFKENVPWYLVPIKERYSNLLFPESSHQSGLFIETYSYGNSIRKSYLCHSKIAPPPPGSVLVFYRSEGNQGIIAIGILELSFMSQSEEEIARSVFRRTIYSLNDIKELCQRPTKILNFRQSCILFPEIPVTDLKKNVFVRPPQSINTLKKEAIEWLKMRIKQ